MIRAGTARKYLWDVAMAVKFLDLTNEDLIKLKQLNAAITELINQEIATRRRHNGN